jgi:hypothetical protein
MDDVDAVQAQIAGNMLKSGDWVTARLDGVAYLEKSPLIYWMMAVSYRVFGVHDWAARVPLALSIVLLCWVTFRFARWAFGDEAGLYSGLALSTCVGLYLFTRILIPDAIVTLTMTTAIWAWLRLLEPDCDRPQRWSLLLGLSFAAGLLLKGLIAIVFPIGAAFVYMAITRQLLSLAAWKKLRLPLALAVTVIVAAPWHILATLRNPPYFDFTMHSGPGEYRGFFWFYFFNEHILRFLDLRYPRDYNTVPRLWFWLFNLIWLFPWSAYLPGVVKLSYSPSTREGRVRLMSVCWIAVVMVFFTFSTTQEYYSMPIYPAMALLLGSALANGNSWQRVGTRVLVGICGLLGVVLFGLLVMVWRIPAVGDIYSALTQNPDLYTLSLGHMTDLTFGAFAYLKLPLAIAALAFGIGAVSLYVFRNSRLQAALALAAAMVLFFQASRIALVRFESYLGSYPLAQAVEKLPPGKLIEANAYYAFSTVFFYTGRDALLWNGRSNNLEYGSYAPGAPKVFIDDDQMRAIWDSPRTCYLLTYPTELSRLESLVGKANIHVIAQNAGNFLLSNQPVRVPDQHR